MRAATGRDGAAATAQAAGPAGPCETSRGPRRGADWRDFIALTKPGITRLVLLTTGVGYYLAARGSLDIPGLVHTLVGAGLVSSGTNALNQYFERDVD